MPTVRRQNEMALVRDTAVQKLRDLTIAVALASAAAVALIAWVSAATIPGTADASGQTVTTDGGGQPVLGNDDGFSQRPPRGGTSGYGPGIAVTGGSR
ncbi:MAG: hypothetical protein QOJ33_1333 [Chloroflexota bacterium]|nr:hypothetical protein [Chloroflexota bacterium]